MARVLVVDDESDILELARSFLETAGFSVLTASCGLEALRFLEVEAVDLVLLDVVMPGLSGLDVIRRLKRSELFGGVPVVIFSALGVEVDLMLEGDVKADGYLGKPFSRRQLLDIVEKNLRCR